MPVKLKLNLTTARLLKNLLDSEADTTLMRIAKRKELHISKPIAKRMATRTKRYQLAALALGDEIHREERKQWQRQWAKKEKARHGK